MSSVDETSRPSRDVQSIDGVDLPVGSKFIPLDELTSQRRGRVEVDSWWVTHPDRGALMVLDSPQCNQDERIARLIADRMYPWAVLEFIPSAYIGPEPRGWWNREYDQ